MAMTTTTTTTTTTSQTSIELLSLSTPTPPWHSQTPDHQPSDPPSPFNKHESCPIQPPTTSSPKPAAVSARRAISVIILTSSLLFLTSFTNGLLTIALPTMAATGSLSASLTPQLLVWPTSAYYLTAGSFLLLSGTLADVIGAKRVNLFGAFFGAVFAAACGASRTAGEVIAFRALQGVAYAAVTPSGISIISRAVEGMPGRARNMGFACLGFSQPLGFCVGLVLAGVLVDGVGWRVGFYIVGGCTMAVFAAGVWVLPGDDDDDEQGRLSTTTKDTLKRIGREVDWVGAGLASLGLASLSYVLATLSADINGVRKAPTIVLMIVSVLSVPGFIGWMHRQTKKNRPALIPNSLWRSGVFTSSCIMVLVTNAVITCMELYSSLFFQEVQKVSAFGASVRIIPSMVSGVLTNILTGIFVSKMPVLWTVLVASVMSTVAPLLMTLARTNQPYWENAFFAQILTPISCDILFTVGLLIISDVYPKNMQALGGAVFNTCAQLGAAIGLSVIQVIASSVTDSSREADKSSPQALKKGYGAAFWFMFGAMVFSCLVCIVGLRRVGRVGLKRD